MSRITLWVSRAQWLINKVLKRGRRKRAGSLLADELTALQKKQHRRSSSWDGTFPFPAPDGVMSSAASSQSSMSPRGSPFTSPRPGSGVTSRRGSPYIHGGGGGGGGRRSNQQPWGRSRPRGRWACFLFAFFVFSLVTQLLIPVWFPSLVYVIKHRDLWVDGVPPFWRPVTGLSLATLDQVNFEPGYNLPGDRQHHVERGVGYRPGMHVALATAARVNPTPEFTRCTESEFQGYTATGPEGQPVLKSLVAIAADLKHHARVHALVTRFGDSGRFNFLILHYERASFDLYRRNYGAMWYPDALDGNNQGFARWGGGGPKHRAWSPRGDRGEAGGHGVSVCVVVDVDHRREAMGGHVKLDLARKYLFPQAVRGKYEFIFLWDGDVILEDWRPKGTGGGGGSSSSSDDYEPPLPADAPTPGGADDGRTGDGTSKYWSFWNGDLAWFPFGGGDSSTPGLRKEEGGGRAGGTEEEEEEKKGTGPLLPSPSGGAIARKTGESDGPSGPSGEDKDDGGDEGGFDPVSYVDYVRRHKIHVSQPAYSAGSISAHSFNKHDGIVGPLDDRDRGMGYRPHWWVEIGFPVFHVEKAWVPIYDQVLRVFPFRYFCFDMIPWQCVLDGNITIGIVDGHHTHIVTHDASMKTIFERGISFFTALFQKRQTVLEGWWRQLIMDQYGCCDEKYFDVHEEPTLAVCGARPPPRCAGAGNLGRRRPFAGWSGSMLYPGPLEALERSPV